MTNDKTVTMSRELAERLTKQYTNSPAWDALEDDRMAATEELREILDAPVVERQEPIGIEGMPQYLILFDDTERPVETMFGEEIARKRYADISMSWNAHLFVKIDSNSRDAMFAKNNATVVTSPPAPVALDDSTTSDKYRAELYDEVWQKARDMGFANVTDALERLDNIDGCPRLDKVKELNR